jgi:hypothetical protein
VDGTGYDPHTGVAMDAIDAASKFEWSALWYFVGHGGPGWVTTRHYGLPDEVDLYGRCSPVPAPPSASIDGHDLTSCRLVVFDSCGGGLPLSYGLLAEIAVQQGADCAVAFANAVRVGSVWTTRFWQTLAEEDYGGQPAPVWWALQRAEGADPGSHPDPVVWGNVDLIIRPAAYGAP